MDTTDKNEKLINEEIYSYTNQIDNIMDLLQNALQLTEDIYYGLPEAYEGMASEDITIFFWSMNQRIAQLLSLYGIGKSYIEGVYANMMISDMMTKEWIEQYFTTSYPEKNRAEVMEK